MPIDSSCTPPKNNITAIVDDQPATGSPKKVVLKIITIIKKKAMSEIIIPANEAIRSGAVVKDVMPSIARFTSFG